MNIWRLTIKPAEKEDGKAAEFCIKTNILGVGWSVEHDQKGPLDWDTYYRLGRKKYVNRGWSTALNAVGKRMQINDLCWTRDSNQRYYLGRVEGDWKYRPEGTHDGTDIVNIRPCRWFPKGGMDVTSVPGKVVNSFSARSTVQQVHDKTVERYSKLKYNELSGEDFYDLTGGDEPDLFSLIAHDDCEDIVGIYLQEKYGYRLIPSTCKRDMAKTEFVLKGKDGTGNGATVQVQVKQGGIVLNRDDYIDNECEWFLLTTHGSYTGEENEHVHCLDPDEIRDFALKNRDLMSGDIQTFIDIVNALGK